MSPMRFNVQKGESDDEHWNSVEYPAQQGFVFDSKLVFLARGFRGWVMLWSFTGVLSHTTMS
jgi:hypothetical protein